PFGNEHWLFREIDQDDVRVLLGAVEHNMFSVGLDVERPQGTLISEAGERTRLLGGEIEQREIESLNAWQVYEAGTVGQETIAARAYLQRRQRDGRAVRSDSVEFDLADDGPPAVHNELAAWRPDRIDPLAADKADGGPAVDRD